MSFKPAETHRSLNQSGLRIGKPREDKGAKMKVLSVDLGATSGKVSLVEKQGDRIFIEEKERFKTQGTVLPADRGEILVWDAPRFFENVVGVLTGKDKDRDIASVGVDTWGVDFALLDSWGRLIYLPYHYRDKRTKGVVEKAWGKLGGKDPYKRTGTQSNSINTLYQLYSMIIQDDPALKFARTLLMMPDLFNYWLSGEKVCEYTIATTSQCYSTLDNNWAYDVLETLSIPTHIFPEVVPPTTILGNLRLGSPQIKVVATACHDTASAVVAVPFEGRGVYVSSGTWSVVGVELKRPVVSEQAMKFGFTNEGGFRSTRFLKNATGMWLLEECNKDWNLGYAEIIAKASSAPEFTGFIDPDDNEFLLSGGMEGKIAKYLKRTAQEPVNGVGTVARLIFENLALNYRWIIGNMERILDETFDTVYVVGGGARNTLLNQFIANATEKVVFAGPYEAATIGNAIVQMIALGEIPDLEAGRRLVRVSFPLQQYKPAETGKWSDVFETWKQKTGKE